MRTVAEANKYFSEQAPWKLRESDPERMRTVLHVALQLVDDAKTLLTPFLPRSSQQVHEMLGGTGTWSEMPRVEEVDEAGGPSYPVITGTYDSTPRWASVPLRAGTPAGRAQAAVRQAGHLGGGRGTRPARRMTTCRKPNGPW